MIQELKKHAAYLKINLVFAYYFEYYKMQIHPSIIPLKSRICFIYLLQSEQQKFLGIIQLKLQRFKNGHGLQKCEAVVQFVCPFWLDFFFHIRYHSRFANFSGTTLKESSKTVIVLVNSFRDLREKYLYSFCNCLITLKSFPCNFFSYIPFKYMFLF